MLPVNRNLTVYRGDSFELSFRLRAKQSEYEEGTVVDLTGVEGKAQLRESEDATEVLAEFGVDIDPSTDLVTISLTPAQTTTLPNGVYDVQLTWPDGKVKTYLKGSLTTVKEVTRA